MRKRAKWAVEVSAVLLCGALALTACGSSGSASESAPSTEATGAASTDAGEPNGADDADTTNSTDREVHVGIALIAQVEVMDIVVDHFKEALAQAGYTNVVYDEKNAQGNAQTASLIVKQMLGAEPDLVFTIGTPLVMNFLQAGSDIPVLFGAMTDPVGAGVVKSLEEPGGTFTGTSDVVTAQDTFGVIEALVPGATSVGFLGNMSEQNTAVQLADFTSYAEAHGMTITTAPIAKSSDLQLAISSLAGKVDVLLAGTDNTVASAIATAGQAALAAKLPFVMAAGLPPTAGLLASFGADYPSLGTAGGRQAAEILAGKTPAEVPVITPETGGGYEVFVNTDTADALGVTVPDSVLGQAPNLVAE